MSKENTATLSSLRSYSRGLVNRLHGAEVQQVKADVEALDKAAVRAADDLPAEVTARVGAIALGARRLQAVSGGMRFEGQASLRAAGDEEAQ
ncbi:MAG: hypothetical protein ACWGSD_18565, partial [Thermodesulfobacteriota bacterium]